MVDKKKKEGKESSPPSTLSAPVFSRTDPNGDQSGINPKNNTADYTISDETQYDEGFVAGVSAVRGTPVQMSSTPRGRKHRNAPSSAASLQRAADKRRMQLDRLSQKRAAAQKRIGRRQQTEQLSLTNLAQKVGAESKAKMPKDKLTHSFKKFSEFTQAIDEEASPMIKPPTNRFDHTKEGRSAAFAYAKEHGGKVVKTTFTHPTTGMVSKHFKVVKEEVENLEEGRPKKNATSEDPGSDHIVMQLRKAISLRGQHPVKFVNGKSSLVSPATAHRLLTMHDNMKTAAEKDHFAKHIHKSVDHMRDALAGKMPEPEKKTISLGGSHGDHRK